MRLFLALDLSPIARNALSEYVPKVQEKLDRQGLKWVSPERWHVTLAFVGDEDVEKVKSLSESALNGLKEVRLRIEPIGGFPDTKRPSILYLGLSESKGNLNAIHRAISLAFEDAGLAEFISGKDLYVPHVTIGRMKPASTKLGHRLRDFMHSGAKPEEIEWTAEKVTLFNAKADGSYEVVAEFPLGR